MINLQIIFIINQKKSIKKNKKHQQQNPSPKAKVV